MAGVPQGSIIAPTLFLIFVNDLVDYCPIKNIYSFSSDFLLTMYADDTLFSTSGKTCSEAANRASFMLKVVAAWASDWGMSFNPSKTELMLSPQCSNQSFPQIQFEDVDVRFVEQHMHVGYLITSDLKSNAHALHLCSTIAKDIYLLRQMSHYITSADLLSKIYKIYIRPKMEYANVSWVGLNKTLSDRLEALQRREMRIILNIDYRENILQQHHVQLRIGSLVGRRLYGTACYAFKMLASLLPEALNQFCPTIKPSAYPIRNAQFSLPSSNFIQSRQHKRSPLSVMTSLMNFLGANCFEFESMNQFRGNLNLNIERLDDFWNQFN